MIGVMTMPLTTVINMMMMIIIVIIVSTIVPIIGLFRLACDIRLSIRFAVAVFTITCCRYCSCHTATAATLAVAPCLPTPKPPLPQENKIPQTLRSHSAETLLDSRKPVPCLLLFFFVAG